MLRLRHPQGSLWDHLLPPQARTLSEELATVDALLSDELMRKARERKLLRGRKLRVDTTVIQAPIEHPADIGLLDDGVRVITRTVKRLQDAGAAARTAFRDRTRTIKRALRAVGQALRGRTGEAKAAVEAQTARALRVARQVVRQAERIKANSRRAVQHLDDRTGRVIHQGRQKLATMLRLTRRLMAQTEQRLQGIRSIPDRLVSVFNPEARPICRGKLSAKTEFGYKALITETEERMITHYQVHGGNPADSDLLQPAFAAHVQVIGRTPEVVATDRGFGSKANEAFLAEQRVRKISLPYPGRRSEQRCAHERQRWFRRQQRRRAAGSHDQPGQP